MKTHADKLHPEAERLAVWAFKRLLNEKDSTPYPLARVSIQNQKDESKPSGWRAVALTVLPPAKAPRPRAPLTAAEVLKKSHALEKALERAAKEAEEILSRAGPANVNIVGLSISLRQAIERAQAQLVRLADMGNADGVEALARSTLNGANELWELSRRNLPAVQAVARTCSHWPVLYSPHKDWREKTLQPLVDSLNIGAASQIRVQAKWSNEPAQDQPHRHVVGGYARSMGFMLCKIHDRAQGGLDNFIRDNPDGWPAWIVRLVQLPPLTRASAPDWFVCGFEALTEAAGGSVARIPELRPVGDRRAKEWIDQVASKKQVEGQRALAIEEALRKAFRSRFGA